MASAEGLILILVYKRKPNLPPWQNLKGMEGGLFYMGGEWKQKTIVTNHSLSLSYD